MAFCIVFYPCDKSIQIQRRELLTFQSCEKCEVSSKVFCKFPTTELSDDGVEKLVEMEYEGVVVFMANSRKQCMDRFAAFKEKVHSSLDEGSIVAGLIELGKHECNQLKKCGKRGAAARLNAVLDELTEKVEPVVKHVPAPKDKKHTQQSTKTTSSSAGLETKGKKQEKAIKKAPDAPRTQGNAKEGHTSKNSAADKALSKKEVSALTMLAGFTSVLSGPQDTSTVFESVEDNVIGDFVKENCGNTYTSLKTNTEKMADLTEQLKVAEEMVVEQEEQICHLKEENCFLREENQKLKSVTPENCDPNIAYHLRSLVMLLGVQMNNDGNDDWEILTANPVTNSSPVLNPSRIALLATTQGSPKVFSQVTTPNPRKRPLEDCDEGDVSSVASQAGQMRPLEDCDEGDVSSVASQAGQMKPLILDRDDPARFSSVLVDKMKLYHLEQRALKKKADNPQAATEFILNRTIDLVFTPDTLAQSCGLGLRTSKSDKGRKPLKAIRVEAIKEYLKTMCQRHSLPHLTANIINQKFATKCTNARRNSKQMSSEH